MEEPSAHSGTFGVRQTWVVTNADECCRPPIVGYSYHRDEEARKRYVASHNHGKLGSVRLTSVPSEIRENVFSQHADGVFKPLISTPCPLQKP